MVVLRFELHCQAAVQRGDGVCDAARDGEEGAPLSAVSFVSVKISRLQPRVGCDISTANTEINDVMTTGQQTIHYPNPRPQRQKAGQSTRNSKPKPQARAPSHTLIPPYAPPRTASHAAWFVSASLVRLPCSRTMFVQLLLS